jgi:hypothetical protein
MSISKLQPSIDRILSSGTLDIYGMYDVKQGVGRFIDKDEMASLVALQNAIKNGTVVLDTTHDHEAGAQGSSDHLAKDLSALISGDLDFNSSDYKQRPRASAGFFTRVSRMITETARNLFPRSEDTGVAVLLGIAKAGATPFIAIGVGVKELLSPTD